MTSHSRRALLAGLAGVATTTVAGCGSLPAGPTSGLTLARTRRLAYPDPGHPYATPLDAHVLATRAHLDALVTAAEPLLAHVSESDVGDDRYRDLRIGVDESRDVLAETADEPASADNHGIYVSYVPNAGYALGFLRAWHRMTGFDAAERRLRRVRAAVAETAAAFDCRCDDPARLLAGVGWAERELHFADIADVGDPEPPAGDSRRRRANYVARLVEHAEKMRRDVRSARYTYRAFDAERPTSAEPFADALASNRRAVRTRMREAAVDDDAAHERAESTDDPALSTFRYRVEDAVGEADESRYRVAEHLDRNRGVLAAVAAARAVCHYRGYHAAVDRTDPDEVTSGPHPDVLFGAKRRAVRAIRTGLDGDPFRAWLLDGAARLVRAGDDAFENDLLDSDAQRRAAALAYYRRGRGYAVAARGAAGTLERR
jgi:hypothetical protein